MKKRLWLFKVIIITSYLLASCSFEVKEQSYQPVFDAKTNVVKETRVFGNRYVTTDDFLTLTKRTVGRVFKDKKFKNITQNEVWFHVEAVDNYLVEDNNKTNDAIKKLLEELLEGIENISIIDNYKGEDAYFIETKFFIIQTPDYRKEQIIEALAINLFLYDYNNKEVKVWSDYLIKTEDFGDWQ